MKTHQLQVFIEGFCIAWLDVVSFDKETVTVVWPLKTGKTITFTLIRDGTELFREVEAKEVE